MNKLLKAHSGNEYFSEIPIHKEWKIEKDLLFGKALNLNTIAN